MNLFQGFKDWYNTPYSPGMSAKGWFLFIGMTTIFLIIWKMITIHLFDE